LTSCKPVNFSRRTLHHGVSNKEIYASVKKPTITKKIRLNRLHLFGHIQRMEENRIPKKVYMNLEMRLRGRPRNRWQERMED